MEKLLIVFENLSDKPTSKNFIYSWQLVEESFVSPTSSAKSCALD